MPVKYVIWHSIIRRNLKDINAYTVVNALIFVMCVIRHSLIRTLLEDINAYILVSTLILVMCVIKHSDNGVI